jgi:predicted  nucleic acid-binding Zn-ribbon protein
MVQLQTLAHNIRELRVQKEAGPRRLQELEDLFQATLEDIGAARLRYETLESERRQLETEVAELDAKLEKYHSQLMSVTNAREYSAALNEIDGAKTARDRATEGILSRQVEEEELAEAVQEADARIAEARAKTDTEKSRIEKELSEVDAKIETLSTEQDEVESALDNEMVSVFKRVFAARAGVAMAPVLNNACSACNLRLRPQVFNEVRRGEKLVPCDNCRRFLYVDERPQETPETSSGGEGGGGDAGPERDDAAPSEPSGAETAPVETAGEPEGGEADAEPSGSTSAAGEESPLVTDAPRPDTDNVPAP